MVQHITHSTLGPVEYYFCNFSTLEEVELFVNKINYKEQDSLDNLDGQTVNNSNSDGQAFIQQFNVHLNEPFVLEAHTEQSLYYNHIWYERLDVQYFRRMIKEKANAYMSIAMAADGFFR